MSLIKIFPVFSPETERNIQADLVGEFCGLNLYFRDSAQGKDFYLEIPMAAGSLFERACSVYNNPYNLEEEIQKVKIRLSVQYSDAREIKDQRYSFYAELYQNMCNGELVQNRHFLVSYTKYKIIFGELAHSEEEFNSVLTLLKEKQLIRNAAEKAERDERNRIEEQKRNEARIAQTNKIKAQIIADEQIDGEDLVDFCKDHGIEMHIRTQGTIKQKVSLVNSCSYRVQRGTVFKINPCEYYKQLKKLIEAEKEKEDGDELLKVTNESYRSQARES